MTDRPQELIDLLDHLADVMPPLTEEEQAVFDRWQAKHGGTVGPDSAL